MTTVNDPKGEAGSKKAPMWLLPPVALEQTAWVHKLGNDKYGPFNWRKTGVCATTYVSAIMRHLNAWRDGEDRDPESGISHIAHIATSCNILLDAAACGTLQDDRNKRPTSRLEEHKQAFRDILDGMTKEELLADLEARRPSADDHPTHLAAYLEDAGRQLQQDYAEKILTTEDPWLKLTKQPTLSQIEIDGKLVDLPPVPEGYDRWVDRGVGWDTGCRRVPCFACVWVKSPDIAWSVYHDDTANGVDCTHYIEAVKDSDNECQKATVAPLPGVVKVVDHDIKPGDKVTGRLVHGEDFCGTIANVVDIRGTKLFQFLDRASISEDQIYTITHA